MNKENSIECSLQLGTCEAIIDYSKSNNVFLLSACDTLIPILKKLIEMIALPVIRLTNAVVKI